MRIGILSRNARLYSTRRLVEAGRARGHRMRVLDTFDFAVSMEEGFPDLYYRGKPLPAVDAVIPRIGASITYFGTAVVRQFEQMEVFCANSALGIANSRDKLRSLQMLSKFDIGIPPTEFVSRRKDVLPAIRRLGGAPVIIKLLEGTQGVGVILADSEKVAQAIVETLQSTRQDVLLQKFIAESRGTDVRAFVVGDRVVAAMRRRAQGTEFRSNVHRGGKAEAIDLPEKYEETAIRAAQVLGLRVAGVDMLQAADGPQVAEVNSSPGLEGIEKATRIDVADAIIQYMEDRIKFPELDIRQRLTVSRGWGVAELPIGKNTAFAGKRLGECGFEEADILVLSLNRDGRVVNNPSGRRELKAGDRLLCFGKLEELKSLIPDRRKRRRRKPKRLRKSGGG